MTRVRSRLAIALLFGALFVFAYIGTILLGGPIDFLYRNAAGLNTARTVAQIAVILSTAGLFITGLIVTIPIAFRPGNLLHKMVFVLPVYLLLFTLFLILAAWAKIGTTGILFSLGFGADFTLTGAGIAIAAILTAIAVLVALLRTNLGERTLNRVATMAGITALPTLVATVAMVASIAIVASSQPSRNFGGRPGGDDGNRPGFQNPGNGNPGNPSGQGGQFGSGNAAATQNAGDQANQTAATQNAPAPNGTQPVQGGFGGPGRGEGRGGGEGRGFPPGGPGGPGGSTNVAAQYGIGGGLTALFGLLMFATAMIGFRTVRRVSAPGSADVVQAPQPEPINYRRQIGPVIAGMLGISVIGFLTIQVIQVSHTNPPVQTTVQWDSRQTQQLWTRACSDCHSNETVWPWYSYIAPASWLQAVHVKDARQQFNISELNNGSPFEKSRFAGDAAEQIRSHAMPPRDYEILHPEARLSDAEQQQLIQGLQATLGQSQPGG